MACFRLFPRQHQIAEFLVLKRRVAALERFMQPASAARGRRSGTSYPPSSGRSDASLRTRRGDICSQRRSALPRTARRLANPCGVPGSMSTSICSHASQSFPGHTAAAWKLPARRAYSPRTPAPARGRAAPSPSNRTRPTRACTPHGFAHQLLADGAHRGFAFQTRRFRSSPSSASAANVTAPVPAPQSSRVLGASPARRQRLGQRRFRRFHRRGHARKRISRRLALPRSEAACPRPSSIDTPR